MDNDLKVTKILKKAIRIIKYKIDYYDLNIIPETEGNYLIQTMISEDKPFFVARAGATEMRCIAEFLKNNHFSDKISDQISQLSGVFPNDETTLRKFCKIYISAISKADLISLWGVGAESKVVHRFCKNSKFTELHALEPYYHKDPWAANLANKKVLIVHPFKKSIEYQYKRREQLFTNQDILPQFKSLECIKAVQSIAGEDTRFTSWFEALEYMKQEIREKDFDVAIIGAGAYGLPLASYCKEIGKQAIQMSGATQLLFGIKGKRWDKHPYISKLYNDKWVRPDESEKPKFKNKVEGGSYW